MASPGFTNQTGSGSFSSSGQEPRLQSQLADCLKEMRKLGESQVKLSQEVQALKRGQRSSAPRGDHNVRKQIPKGNCCFKCGAPGHYARDCRPRSQSSPQVSGNGKMPTP